MTTTGRVESCSTVDEAIAVLSRLVADQAGGDAGYFKSQSGRFRYAVARIHDLCPQPCRVLDIGSHYLHQASLLRLLGHEVVAVDVPVFSTADFIVERSRMLGISNLTIENLEDGSLLAGGNYEGTFDLVVFTAILEHITFNPVNFWRRVYDLMTDRGRIYLTTPNGLRPAAMLNHLTRLITFAGVGLPVKGVLEGVTYSHHWKEYSSREIEEYFSLLSPDFHVIATCYADETPRRGARGALGRFAGILPFFRPDIEAIVSLSGKSGRFLSAPELPMVATRRSSEASESAT